MSSELSIEDPMESATEGVGPEGIRGPHLWLDFDGPGPAATPQGPFYIDTKCRGIESVSLNEPQGKKWRTKGELTSITEAEDGIPKTLTSKRE